MRLSVMLVALLTMVSSSLAQVIYEPARFQYGDEDRKFYYGGVDPQTMRRGAFYGIRTINNEPLRVYTDLLPDVNAAIYGFTIDDARNEAGANIPTYFRKSDPIPGTRVEDGAVVVPQRPMFEPPPGRIVIRPYAPHIRRPMSPVFVFPKRLLNQTLPTAPKA